MPRALPLAAVLIACLTLPACGGSSGDDSPTGGTPPAGGNDPCAAALADDATPFVAAFAAIPGKPRGDRRRHDVRDVRDLLWAHRAAAARGLRALDARDVRDEDVGDLAVLNDDGSLVLAANPFDLANTGLRFTRNAAGGYDVARADATLRTPLGSRLTLGDDDAAQASVPFSFPFYGRPHGSVFVNSDGNLTFEQSDTATTERSVGRVLAGPPRVAPFFADLDPTAGGRIFMNATASAFTVTWCSVRGFDLPGTVTTQASLFPDGSIEVRFGAVTLDAAVTGVGPGRTSTLASVDLRATPVGGGAGAVLERFAASSELDLVTASRRFLASHPDDFDQLVFFTDTRVVETGTFAFQTTINNDIRGIGKDVFNAAGEFGSGGRLQGLVVMDDIGKFPEEPTARVPGLGEDSTLSVLGQEVGHRWGAHLLFRDAAGRTSEALLGRAESHWSFFFDSDGSVLEGNEIEDLGGSFRTGTPVQRYGPLDLYAMGLIGPGEVPTVFFVENPTGTTRTNDSEPRSNVSFGGTRRDVTISQIVAAMGSREPDASRSPRLHRLGFVHVVGRGRSAQPGALAKLERIRAGFTTFFQNATGGRMTLDTRLR
ncbi:MAG TPA: hypothetical protein VFM29_06920 [Vicinamibacteria bacterium]|nr:hypothetical protein [Vicinamibacteria bacterium]